MVCTEGERYRHHVAVALHRKDPLEQVCPRAMNISNCCGMVRSMVGLPVQLEYMMQTQPVAWMAIQYALRSNWDLTFRIPNRFNR